ncbi:hypothetical protein SDC9_113765 [bioreactor metagenome]|uniref:Uncharacterized protein n=1 Tax=bioreactor metagenome TaxID=1076179 RepID=A0A645BUD5_9ZZZZ
MLAPSTVGVGTAFLTVTAQVAVFPPSVVVTVMVAVPGATAVTRPFASTVATLSLSLRHVTAFSVAPAGATVAISVFVSPATRAAVVSFSVTPVTGTGFTFTSMVLAALLKEVSLPVAPVSTSLILARSACTASVATVPVV